MLSSLSSEPRDTKEMSVGGNMSVDGINGTVLALCDDMSMCDNMSVGGNMPVDGTVLTLCDDMPMCDDVSLGGNVLRVVDKDA